MIRGREHWRGGAVIRPDAQRDGRMDELMSLTARIVSAQVENNPVSVDQLPALIRSVHQALATAGSPEAGQQARPRGRAKEIRISGPYCLPRLRGELQALRRHILANHGLTAQGYRAKWGLPSAYPMVAPDYAALRSTLARQIGLGHRAKAVKPKRRGRPKPG
jgi:predicted transcriptional regulator